MGESNLTADIPILYLVFSTHKQEVARPTETLLKYCPLKLAISDFLHRKAIKFEFLILVNSEF